MSSEQRPIDVIDGMVHDRSPRSDQEILDELGRLPALADEDDACWDDDDYWNEVAYPYLAIAKVARARRLRAAVRLLLDRACYGDPGEIMRGLRHVLEEIMNPDWTALADICIDAARSERRGTILWAVDQLLVLDDERARPLLQQHATSNHEKIRWIADLALERLDEQMRRKDS